MSKAEPTTTPIEGVALDSRVQWIDTDAAGHHHNSSIMRWVEAAEAEMMRRARLPEYFPEAPRVHQSINFSAKLVFGQLVRTRLWIDRIGTTSMTFAFEVCGRLSDSPDPRHSDWLTAASGELVTAHVAKGETASSPWPAEWISALSPFLISEARR
ncbi:acyl-CoA thioesterase [Brevibacterium atlanticum]|uniref:acyl-CoA thioesterase n=1 Tax=Brevibacterium atlanticum TaxID=2697563 RepID=UPI00142110C9|nr:hotdog domain-containing protein [Brevibacterium atlanticum]